VQYVADRRLEELGLEPHYNVTNPAKWMSTATDVFELVNFFEQQNTAYEVDAHGHKKEEEIEQIRKAKSEEKGSFEERIILEKII
jgi:ribonucleotide reductase beta subunit family protein with ferritin-like domain